MTPAPQPEKDIGFGDTIIDEAYRIAIMATDEDGVVDLEKIEKGFLKLRSRLAPALELTEHDIQYAYELGIWHGEMNKDEAARNATLKAYDKIIPTLGKAIQTDVSDNDYVMLEDLESVLDHLRQQAGEQG